MVEVAAYDSISPPNERTSLTTGRDNPRRIKMLWASIYAILFSLFLAQNLGLARCPLNDISAAEKAELRRQWGLERNAHQVELAQWGQEREGHMDELRSWETERAAHRTERVDWLRQRADEEETWRKKHERARQREEKRQQAMRDAFKRERRQHLDESRVWERERVAHRKEHEDWIKDRAQEEEALKKKRAQDEEVWRKKREIERREEETRRQAIRDAFNLEREKEERQRQEARDAFQGEREVWRRQREEEERHRLEVVRRSQGVYWTEPHGDEHCHSYGTRTYYSYLKDIPGDLNWLEVCNNMPSVAIHGREIDKPYKCERNDKGEVVGVWYVDFDEPNCKPYWEIVHDKGCTPGRTGFQRLEARLDGIGSGDDWYMMCATTPATIHGVHFDRPTSCEHRGRWYGMVGMWDFPNPNCCE